MPGIQDLPVLPGGIGSADSIAVGRGGFAYQTPATAIAPIAMANYAALRANLVATPYVLLLGGATQADGAEGYFILAATDRISADNGGTVIVDAGGNRYYRQSDLGSANILWFGAKSDCQMVTTNISMSVGSNVLTSSVAVFAPGDVGKSIAVTRTDAMGWCPWWGTGYGYTAVTTITQYISPTQVQVSAVGSGTPPANNAASWPYNNTPSILTWGTDAGPAINAALAAADGVIVPDGNFAVATQILLKSRNTLSAQRNAGKLFNLGGVLPISSPQVGYSGFSGICPMFVNRAWRAFYGPGWPVAYGQNAAAIAATGDTDISICGLEIEMSQAGCQYGQMVGRFLFLQNGKFSNNRITGNLFVGFEGFNLQACDSIEISDNSYLNCFNGFNPYGGCTNIRFERNKMTIPQVTWPSYTYTSAVPLAIGINANGYSGSQPSRNVEILDNTIYLNGSTNAGQDVAGIYLFPATDNGESFIGDSRIERNTIFCTGVNNSPITLIGAGVNNTVKDNIVIGADGTLGEPIKGFALSAQQTSGLGSIVSATSANGQTTLSINWTSHNFTGESLTAMPFYLLVSGGPTVGGQSLSGYFQVLGVTDANNFTIKLAAAATSTQTVTWNGAFADIQAAPNGTTIQGNKLRDCKSAANSSGNGTGAIIYCEGEGNIIDRNDVSFGSSTYISGATAIPYTALVATNGATGRPMIITNNTGPTGTGSLPAYYSGTNRICYIATPPIIIDPNETTGALSLSKITISSFSTAGFTIDASGNLAANSINLGNSNQLNLKDTAGNAAYLLVQGDNNLVLYGTNGSGGHEALITVAMNTPSPVINLGGSATNVAGVLVSGGTGAPGSGTPGSAFSGSVFSRSDGSSGSHIYISQGNGSWNAIPGV